MVKFIFGCAVLATLFSGVRLADAGAFTNGSFESGNFVDNTGQKTDSLNVGDTSMTGWTVVSDSIAWINTVNPFGLTAAQGNYFLDLTDYHGPTGGVSQSFDTVAGHAYTVTFELGSDPQYGIPDGLLAQAVGSTNNVLGGNSFLSTSNGSNVWAPESFTFTADGSTTTLTFVANAGDNYVGLDNVAVSSAVPEPSSFALLGLGGLGLAIGAYRRSRGVSV